MTLFLHWAKVLNFSLCYISRSEKNSRLKWGVLEAWAAVRMPEKKVEFRNPFTSPYGLRES